MALEISVGPPRLAIHQGEAILISEQDGQIAWPTDKGLYSADTRLISAWQIYANGESWDLLSSANIAYFAARVFLANRAFATEDGDVPAGSLGLVISRMLGHGLHEDLDLVNHGSKLVRFNLEIAIRSDFADLFEVKSGHIVRRGRIQTEWSQKDAALSTRYKNQDFERLVTVRMRGTPIEPVYANGRISVDVELPPGAAWRACLLYEFSDGHTVLEAPAECVEEGRQSKFGQRLRDWRETALKITTSNEELYRFYHQAVEDMAALRLPLADTRDFEFVPAAGVPWFVGLFGRDSLIVSLQNSLIYPGFARGSLEVLGRLQATERDDYRDAEPGKIMHELRRGELAHFKLIPHTPYYGTADATPLYLIVLHNAWRATGDHDLIDRHMATAERCLEWIDQYGDRDGDGFQEYQTRSPAGYENQGWKDSGEALVYEDGSQVKGPKALCELQGYVYDAWRRMAEIHDARGDLARARELRDKARALFERFNAAFWSEEQGFYAFCLDGDKRPVFSVASNPGHCLWSGIVPPDRARRVVERLMAPDMWSGWGIRTLSASHPAYDPHSYQRGSVWPHDNGIIALGFRRYGFAAEAAMIARDVSRAAGYFAQHRMPELYAGLQRSATSFPVQYKGANVPQAWAAGSCFHLIQAITGVRPDGPNGKLYIDPVLPDWLPDLTLHGLRAGDHGFDLRLWRDGADTRWEVLKGDPARVEHRAAAIGAGLEGVG
jgi:glycogen debranching enzyme